MVVQGVDNLLLRLTVHQQSLYDIAAPQQVWHQDDDLNCSQVLSPREKPKIYAGDVLGEHRGI